MNSKELKQLLKKGVDLIVVDTAHGHTKKVGEIIKIY
jgi:IMP dehydrogenase